MFNNFVRLTLQTYSYNKEATKSKKDTFNFSWFCQTKPRKSVKNYDRHKELEQNPNFVFLEILDAQWLKTPGVGPIFGGKLWVGGSG